ncbi:hypothetical protein AAIB41_17000 [Brucella sp. BE17]|uniref:hypothetical protein n=1 Tax=Brucella sp. BE17 TaxID=3142977 RepID=UPI0031BB542E
MALQYRKRVQQLYETLQHDSEDTRMEAVDAIRSLVDAIVLTPADGRMEIDVRGDLAGILAISVNAKKPFVKKGLMDFQGSLVAGARNYRYRHSLQIAV